MRAATILAALALLAAACGSPAEQVSVGEQADDTVSLQLSTTTAPANSTSTTPTSTTPGERPPADQSQSSAYPEDGFPPDEQPSIRLSIEDALLPDDAFGAPWEPQRRQLDAVGYGAGPNQTDCDEYWAYEELLGGDGGHAMWWVDGGNANHRVTRIADQGEVLARLVALGSIAENCPVVRWNEGGEFRVELFTPDVEALIMRFTDEASGEITWVAITSHGDLLSVLQIPLWTRADGTMIPVDFEDMTSVAAEMAQLVQDAGPERTPPPPTTTVPEPPTIVPPQVPTPPLPTSTVPLDSLGQLLLVDGEAIDGWTFDGVTAYQSGGSDDGLVEACPAAESLDAIDQVLSWEAEFETSSGDDAVQIIGEMPDAAAATAVVEQFAEVAECDLTAVIPGAIGSGGSIRVDGADAAGTLFIESEELEGTRLELGAAAIGSIVTVFTLEAEMDADDPGADLLGFTTLGVTKIAAG
jgi:hypothetical protein